MLSDTNRRKAARDRIERRLREQAATLRVIPQAELYRRTLAALDETAWDVPGPRASAARLAAPYGLACAAAAALAVAAGLLLGDPATPPAASAAPRLELARLDELVQKRIEQLEDPIEREAMLLVTDARQAGRRFWAGLPIPEIPSKP